jgi:alpha-D-xyloside xylohydrolase
MAKMRFSDGYWRPRNGMRVFYPNAVYEIEPGPRSLRAFAPIRPVENRRNTLNNPVVTIDAWSPRSGVIGVRVTHHTGSRDRLPAFTIHETDDHAVTVASTDECASLVSGDLEMRIDIGAWNMSFWSGGELLTASEGKAAGYAEDADGGRFIHDRLTIDVGERLYGFGERSTAFVKNGQTVDTWNNDGGPSSDHAYKSIPFYLSSKGYGVFVNSTSRVSFEIGSEFASRSQFSVPGETLEYFVIAGGTPKEVISRYTALTGRPAVPPPWSFGLWLSTSFVTAYDEHTVMGFIDEMQERKIPLSVFHFDTFWMREFHWCDFQWDTRAFPDPEGMLTRLHEKGLRTSVWINPYVAQQSALFEEGRQAGFFLTDSAGNVIQTDVWQAGMAIVDFTNPRAAEWFASKLRALLDSGVDCFKTDFGEHVPLDAVFHDGSSALGMHNYYSFLYNKTVFETLQDAGRAGDAVVFARSATVGSQQFPVHWGGDPEPTYLSMAESLRAGLSLGMCGFGFWSHDIGGFEGNPSPELFMRWAAFGLLSSHSRLHGSVSYRVPWAFGEKAAEVVRHFAKLKMRLMPYLYRAARQAGETGIPVMRAMILEFPDDPNCAYLDQQYMLGDDLLVAPVFSDEGTVTYYVPEGEWTDFLTRERVKGPRWVTETHDVDSLPILVRPGAVIPVGDDETRPDYDYLSNLRLEIYPSAGADASGEVRVPSGVDDRERTYAVVQHGSRLQVNSDAVEPWSVVIIGRPSAAQAAAPGERGSRGLELFPSAGLVATDPGAQA